MVERVMEIGSQLPPNLLLNRKFLVDGYIPDVHDFASDVGKHGWEIAQRERSLCLRRKDRGVEPDIVGRVELGTTRLLGCRVPLAIVEVGGPGGERRGVRETEGES